MLQVTIFSFYFLYDLYLTQIFDYPLYKQDCELEGGIQTEELSKTYWLFQNIKERLTSYWNVEIGCL